MKKYLTGIIALFISLTVFAAPRTAEQAAALAAQFTNNQPQARHLHRTPRTAGEMRLVHQTNKPSSAEPALYVFNRDNNGGFVIVSADDNAVTILGYADEGSFDAANMPSNVRFWLDYYAERIAVAQPAVNKGKPIRKAKTTTAISPLLDIEGIKWNQTAPYYNMCPSDVGGRCVTGCVATAAAQIMRFWKWPVQGQGSHSYTWEKCTNYNNKHACTSSEDVVLSVDFSQTTYDWDNMLPQYGSGATQVEKDAVALLMYHVGVSCNMAYASTASGAWTDIMGDALVSNFGYKNTAQYYTQFNNPSLTIDKITNYFLADLQAGRPILMGGETADHQAGHEFVCDGVDANGLFHINWGWGGMSNGYFALSALDPDNQGTGGASSNEGYATNIDFILGVEPDREPVHVTGISIEPTEVTIGIKGHADLTVTVLPAEASNKAIVWSSADEHIATVNAGRVIGVSAGTTTVTATTNDGGFTATCAVTVTDEVVLPTALVVDQAYVRYLSSEQFWVLVMYENATNVPWVQFYMDYDGANKIAGTYDLAGGYADLWNDPDDDDAVVTSTSGQLSIACVSADPSGCNTYHVLALFTCGDGIEYKLDETIELCAEDQDDNPITLVDEAGDGLAYEVTWLADGQQFNQNIAASGIITLPNEQPVACGNGRVFVGWCADENYSSDDAPTFAKNGDVITGNTTYYAVYATPGEGGSAAVKDSVTFSALGYDNADDVNGETIEIGSNSSIVFNKGTNTNTPKYYNDGSAIRLYGGGNCVVAAKSGTINRIKFTFGTGDKSNAITANKGTYSNGLWTGTEASVTFTVGGTSSHRRFATVAVTTTGSTTYSAYSTTCEQEATAIDNTIVATPAEIRIENGQIVIVLGNERYTILGQKIQ